MAFPYMRRLGRLPQNETAAGITQLPPTILDTFIPGYSIVSKYILDVFAFDISVIASICVLLFAFTFGGQFALKHIGAQFFGYFSSSVTIYNYDPIYDNILEWVAEQAALRQVRNLRGYSAGESFDEDSDEMKTVQDLSEDSIFNFNNWAASSPPLYQPHTGFHRFWHKGRLFWFSVDKERVPGGFMGMMVQNEDRIVLTTIGRSTDPIKALILETRDRHLAHQTSKTVIRRPSPKEQRGRGRSAWNKVAMRPSRPMGTVVLDDKQKAMILKDINDFLHPRTPRWYANRGIPYRRGYLFHGPPGTGKTSLSFALAGVFGLDIYCLSLSEATLTEEDLITLFNSLPRRCVVLLEDIDSAGVLRKKSDGEEEKNEGGKGRNKRKADDKDNNEEKKDEGKEKEDSATATASAIAKAVAQAVKGANDASEAGRRGPSLNNQGVSMSGLLNAIDGVASQEGRVLVMTTNHPEKLDDALVRPGRVDMKIKFTLANKQQIRELFMRMYCEDAEDLMRQPLKLSEILPVTAGGDGGKLVEERMGKSYPKSIGTDKALYASDHITNGHTVEPRLVDPISPMTPTQKAFSPISVHAASSIEELATAFADELPEAMFSPAEIQGFLLTQKKDPLKALLEVGAWRDGELQKKQPSKTGREAKAETEPKGGEKRDRKERATADLKANDSTLKVEEKPVFPETGSKALIGTAEGEPGSESTSSTKSEGSGASGGNVEDSGSE
jgi:mitochondrial chaperone BCS1